MHLNILSPAQHSQLMSLAMFKREFTLVGGTAIALHLGHRRSIDFDLFKPTRYRALRMLRYVRKHNEQLSTIVLTIRMNLKSKLIVPSTCYKIMNKIQKNDKYKVTPNR